MIPNLSDLAFTVLRDIYGLDSEDLDALDPATFVDKVQRVHRGMSTEHEFAAIVSWLGNCSLLTQLDDALHTTGIYRVPDFLVVASHEGRAVPFLVEVKSESNATLKWSETYLTSLRAFAHIVHLPLLVAWKWHGLWVLADTNLFAKKVSAFHLTFEDAAKNSLMSTLFGNVWIILAPEFRLELKMRILDAIDLTIELLPAGTYDTRVEDAGLWTAKGKLSGDEGRDLLWFLFSGQLVDRFERSGGLITQQYAADPEHAFNLSDVLIARLLWNDTDVESIDWLAKIRQGLPSFATDFRPILDRALAVGAVHLVLQQSPKILPEFLQSSSA